MPKAFKVSQSKVKLWRKCRQAYHFKYYENLRRKRISRPFQFGKIVHSMLEAHANGDDPFEALDAINLEKGKLFSAEREMYGELIEDIRTIMMGYFEYHPEDEFQFLRQGKQYAEYPFEVEIEDGLVIKGIIDGAVKTPNKLKWMKENKTFTNMPHPDHHWRNIQSAVYMRVIDVMGWWGGGLDGTLWDYIRSKPPTMPKFTKKTGKLSESKLSTLPVVVRQFLRDNGLKSRDHKQLIVNAEGTQGDYFKRIYTPITKGTVDLLFDGFIDTAREMSKYHGKKQDKNIDRHCEQCDYEPICRAQLMGSDYDYVKEKEYEIDEGPKDKEETVGNSKQKGIIKVAR